MPNLLMESQTVISVKKQRTVSANKPLLNLKVSECIREFKLPQAYPSMAKYQKYENGNMVMAEISLPSPMSSSTISQQNNGPSLDIKSTKKLQKLKLKSLDGRNLGEFDVQILPRVNDNHVENRTISLSTDESLKLNKTMLSMKPDLDKPNTILEYPSSERRKKSGHSVLVPITPDLVANSNGNMHQCSAVNSNQSDQMYVVQSGNNWHVVKVGDKGKKDTQEMISMPGIIHLSCYESLMEVDAMRDESNLKNDMKNLVLKKSPILRSVPNLPLKTVKLISQGVDQFQQHNINRINGNIVRVCGTKRSSDLSLVRPFVKEKKLVDLVSNDLSGIDTENLNDDCNSGVNIITLDNSEDSFYNEKKKKDVNNTVIPRQSYPLRNSHGPVNLIRRGRKDSAAPVKSCINSSNSTTSDMHVNLNTNSTHSSTLSKSSNTLNNLSNVEISNKLSIVGKALSMINDDELRTKALQALADCGIGIERLIPVKPALNQMFIRESQTQTNVFGLLDSNDFVRATGDTDNLDRLQEIERHLIVDDTNISNKPDQEIQTFVKDLDKILEQRWVNKVNVEQVKKILKVSPLVEKACSLMENDFKNVKKYDRNGLLSIHRAIISNQIRAVRRQLMVLRSCKESIDVPTLAGKTGLELGVECSVSSEIINLLLKSGANPTAQVSAHDSALTIAASVSSHFLPQLIKYVSKSGDLNNVDSEGFTALHYCVRNDNIDGILALIRADADLNVRDLKSGRTPLFHAVENDFLPIAKELLANGAKANIPNFSGQTVCALFDDEKHFSMKDVLNKSLK